MPLFLTTEETESTVKAMKKWLVFSLRLSASAVLAKSKTNDHINIACNRMSIDIKLSHLTSRISLLHQHHYAKGTLQTLAFTGLFLMLMKISVSIAA